MIGGVATMAMWDRYPLNPGHAVIAPTPHDASWFEATAMEADEMPRLADDARRIVVEKHRPIGFKCGVNDGPEAWQTAPHRHLYLIPRYRGDVPNERGSVRRIVPARAA